MSASTIVSMAVEGVTDEMALRRLLREAGLAEGPVFGKNGKQALMKRVNGYNQAAHRSPWLVLVDLDHDAECAPPFIVKELPHPASKMCFRVAVRALEAWLLGDIERFAPFMGVPSSRLPANPDGVENPKDLVVALARASHKKAIRQDMVPDPASGRKIGPAYASRLIEFIQDIENGWRPEEAEKRSESLRRARAAVNDLASRK